jgi:hypothetical protein
MVDIFSKTQELVWWAWSYPVPWVWIGWGVVGLVGLSGAVGMVIGVKMKREDRKNVRAMGEFVPSLALHNCWLPSNYCNHPSKN